MNLLAGDDGTTVIVELYEHISSSWGFSAVELSDRLKQYPNATQITLRVHSRGGSAIEGFAIFSILNAHPATVTAEIIGLAASSASVVVMAADRILISEVAFMMIHDPWAYAEGNSESLRRSAAMLDTVQPAIVTAYLRHASLTADDLAVAMSAGEGAGTWYDAPSAIAAGLAHEMMPAGTVPENCLALDDPTAPQAALDLFGAPTAEADDNLMLEVLAELRSAQRPDDNTRPDLGEAADERLLVLLEATFDEEPDDAET